MIVTSLNMLNFLVSGGFLTSECRRICGALVHYMKKIHSQGCEIEYVVETHLCTLCDTPIARITGCVSTLRI